MSSNVYSGLSINTPRRRFTEMDFLMVSIWSAFLLVFTLTPTLNEFMLWVLAGGAVLIANHLYSVVYRGERSQGNLYLAALTPLMLSVTGASLSWVNSMTPITHDAFLLKWDFGIAAAVRAVSVPLMQPISIVYVALPLFEILAVVVLKDTDRKMLIAALSISGLICPFLYLMFPAVGPAHVGDPHAPRNCMPSMHLTWTLLLWVYTKGSWKWFFGTVAFLTAWATLATGEHYSPDLVGGVLFTWVLTVLVKKVQVVNLSPKIWSYKSTT